MSRDARLRKLVETVIRKSPFYRELYEGARWLERGKVRLDRLPVVDQDRFWAANTLKDNRVLTGTARDGVVFKSGGTTGNPKFSVYTRREWRDFCRAFGKGMSAAGLEPGDKVANLFYAGELYASFLFITKSIEEATTGVVHFPLAGSASSDEVFKAVRDFQIGTLAGVPTSLLTMAERYSRERGKWGDLPIRRVLFGGEQMYPDQRDWLSGVFRDAEIRSIGYASVDAGLLGYSGADCGPGEHRVFGADTVVELLDDSTGEPIEEVGRPGRLVVTNLTRTLMPILRYPAGDRAAWSEPASRRNPDRRFVLLGRSEEAARIGPVSLYYEDVDRAIAPVKAKHAITAFQMVLTRSELKDRLTLRIASTLGEGSPRPEERAARTEASLEVERLIGEARPSYAEAARKGQVHPIAVEWTSASRLERNPRTGKLRRVIDSR